MIRLFRWDIVKAKRAEMLENLSELKQTVEVGKRMKTHLMLYKTLKKIQ